MAPRPADLPDFADPPLVEVALSIRFEPLQRLRMAHLGLLWDRYRAEFPRSEEHPPLPLRIESFDSIPGPEVHLEIREGLLIPRCWFLNDVGTQVIQVQQDLFGNNWRKTGPQESYPRYETIRASFLQRLEIFSDFVGKEGLGEILPTQCEVTYVNHILAGEGWERYGQLHEIFTTWRLKYSDSFLSEPDDVRVATRYTMRDLEGAPAGRLYIRVDHATTAQSSQKLFVLTLTAVSRPVQGTLSNVVTCFDRGRYWVVKGFTSITPEKMHRIWKRVQ